MIKRLIEIEGKIEFERYDSENWELILNIKRKDVVVLCMEMQLLEYERSQNLTIKSKNSPNTVTFKMLEGDGRAEAREDKKNFKVSLSRRQVMAMLAYILEYYRDSYASASHMHLEVSEKSPLGRSGDITIVAEKSAKPMSGEEAEQILKNM